MKILILGLLGLLFSAGGILKNGSPESFRGFAPDTRSLPLTATSIPILLYHSIAESSDDPLKVSPSRFEEEMAYLKNEGFHSLHFIDLASWWEGKPLPSKPVMITFDDGYRDNYTDAYPILLKTGMRSTVFIVTGSIDKPGRLTWEQLRIMEASGIMDTQSHTVTHPDLTKLNSNDKERELLNSKSEIKRQLMHTAIAFAYPYGFFDNSTIAAVRKSGYEFAVTAKPGFAKREQGRFMLPRIIITGDMTLDQFKALLK